MNRFTLLKYERPALLKCDKDRVTRWVGEKMAQNVAQPIFALINA
jgi:hypothetical protein